MTGQTVLEPTGLYKRLDRANQPTTFAVMVASNWRFEKTGGFTVECDSTYDDDHAVNDEEWL